jgi:hypothetical protein
MSKYLNLNLADFVKGLIVAAGTAILTALLPVLNTGNLPTLADLKVIAISGVAAGVTYLLKNLFTNSSGTAGPEKAK